MRPGSIMKPRWRFLEKKLGPDAYGLTGILDRLGRLFSEQKK